MSEDRLKPPMDPSPIRVFRGGSWSSTADSARAARRFGSDPGRRSDLLGFRLARNINHEGEQHEKEG